MARSENQKLKLIYILEYLMKYGSAKRGFTMDQLLGFLEEHDIQAERKSIYHDFAALEHYGIATEKRRYNGQVYYYTKNRIFHLSELKLLVDAVQSSKFISVAQSEALIKKLESFASEEDASQLQRQVFILDRIKSNQEDGMKHVDVIHEAIRNNHQISFVYCQWNLKKEMVPRKEGKRYFISPWALLWDDENYYLVGYDAETEILKHYRVDKMWDVKEEEDGRQGQEAAENFDAAAYAKKNFNMYGGQEASVTLECEESLVGVILDRFGQSVLIIPREDGTFRVTVHVMLSNPFFGWVISLGSSVRILQPPEAVESMRRIGQQLSQLYGDTQ